MKAKPVRKKHEKPMWAYAVLESERQRLGDEAFEAMVKKMIVELNMIRAVDEVESVDDKVEVIRQAHEIKKGIN